VCAFDRVDLVRRSDRSDPVGIERSVCVFGVEFGEVRLGVWCGESTLVESRLSRVFGVAVEDWRWERLRFFESVRLLRCEECSSVR
jgi:hypothetical protein